MQAGIPVAGGGGDNAASAVGMGAVNAGEGFLSLGTSGVLFVVTPAFQALLGVAVPRLAALRPTGDLLVHVAELAYAAGEISGNATVEWRSAGSLLTTVSPLGDYELRVEGGAGTMKASLRTVRGPLQLDGKGSREYGGQPVFHATARDDSEHARQLAPFLRLIAIERGEGNFELQLGQNAGQVSKIAAGS